MLDNFDTTIVGGMTVARLSRSETARLTIQSAIDRRNSGQPCLFFTTTNGQVVSMVASRPQVKALYQRADVISADGMSIVKASRIYCQKALPERVATTDAFDDAAALAIDNGATFYFLGAEEELNRRAVEGALKRYPRLKVVGRRNGFFKLEDEPSVVEEINRAAPDVLWVGMGVPRQQAFIVRNQVNLTKVGVAKTCGGLFDFLAGKNKRAPGWMQSSGLEWLFRIGQEPQRLFFRYLLTNPHAIYVILRNSGDDSDTIQAMVAEGWRQCHWA